MSRTPVYSSNGGIKEPMYSSSGGIKERDIDRGSQCIRAMVELRKEILTEAHNSSFAMHSGSTENQSILEIQA